MYELALLLKTPSFGG